MKSSEDFLREKTRSIIDYPKKGIIFRDLTTVFQDHDAFSLALDLLEKKIYRNEIRQIPFKKIAGIEARGFVLAGALAGRLGSGVVLLRKPGKLPYKIRRLDYTLEYGEDALEIHEDAILPGEKVLLIDDLLATGGTAHAAARLIKELGGEVVQVLFLVELPELGGRKRLDGYPVDSVISFSGK
jgi:adenine phosphoribosyltransferase